MWVQRQALSNKDITIIKVASRMKYIDVKLIGPITYGKSKTNLLFAQSTGAVEYTDCFSAEG